ncbi:MAG: hypothetical protein H6750_20395 [Nitrospiraceae bacterium]|nr:hypothetical protein [Nitrospira sp.]MCA9455308.1 hypothetical protein [Nitrospira sp.]MCB9776674.1 hypothetical protein [Nitrospiraceae bacterium]
MPAELILLLIRPFYPFRRYRHGFDPPKRPTLFSFLPTTFDYKQFPSVRPSSFLTLSFFAEQPGGIEPSSNRFRQTLTLHSSGVRSQIRMSSPYQWLLTFL